MSEILEDVLKEFEKLAAIPRQSKHEERVSDFLRDYLRSLGFEVIQDEYKNIIAEIPASEDKKNAPLTILQAHMDMVCVAESGVRFDPLNDPIRLVREEKFLKARGTSLGADDGIGIATILYILKNSKEHGAIRVIFTVDEEQGMTGAIGIDKKYFSDARFLINCDSENFEEICVGSAGNLHVDFVKKIRRIRPDDDMNKTFSIKISGLRGGHSGIEIGDNRANAVKIANKFLQLLGEKGKFSLCNFSSGNASNVIPDSATFKIVTELRADAVIDCGEIVKERIRKIYGDGESNLNIEYLSTIERPEKVWSKSDFEKFSALLTTIHSGIYLLSPVTKSPIVSSNIGIVHTDEDKITINILARSNISEVISDFKNLYEKIARLADFNVNFGTPTPAWDYNADSRLTSIMKKIFKDQNGIDPKINISHGGLECSFFAAKNPKLDIVSVGTTNESIHSPKERLHLNTVEPHVNLIAETLKEISNIG